MTKLSMSSKLPAGEHNGLDVAGDDLIEQRRFIVVGIVSAPKVTTDYDRKEIGVQVRFVRIEPLLSPEHVEAAQKLLRTAVAARMGDQLPLDFDDELANLLSGTEEEDE